MRRRSRGSVWQKYAAVSNQVLPHRRRTPDPADIADSSRSNPLLVTVVRSKLVPWSLWSHQPASGCSANRGRTVWFCLALQTTLVAPSGSALLPSTKRWFNHRLPVSSYHPPALPAASYQLYQVFWNWLVPQLMFCRGTRLRPSDWLRKFHHLNHLELLTVQSDSSRAHTLLNFTHIYTFINNIHLWLRNA